MTDNIVDGMVFAMSNWTPYTTPTWLQGDKCHDSCNSATPFSLMNFNFVSTSDYIPPDDQTDNDEDNNDGDNDDEVDDDDNNDDQNNTKPDDGHMGFNWGDTTCGGNYQLCLIDPDCQDCRWSWPPDDPLLWDSYDAKCRCSTWDGEYAG